MVVETDMTAVIEAALAEQKSGADSLKPLLKKISTELRGLPEEALREVSMRLKVPLNRVYHEAAGYGGASPRASTKHVIRVCVGACCYVKGALEIAEELRALLRVDIGEATPDGEFVVETVNCLGVCATGPVIQIDDTYHKVTVGRLRSLLTEIRTGVTPPIAAGVPVEQSFVARAVASSKVRDAGISIKVCGGTGCASAGCDRVAEALKQGLEDLAILDHVTLTRSGCCGLCERGPIVVVNSQFESLYERVTETDVSEIIGRSVIGNEVIERLLYRDPVTGRSAERMSGIPFYAKQTRRILSAHGSAFPSSIQSYLDDDGYKGLNKALSGERGGVIGRMARAGLRERSGTGKPVADDWNASADDGEHVSCVYCNAAVVDAGLPIARTLLEGNPHMVLEGMIIGGFAVGASEGFVCVQDEQSRMARTVTKAIREARDKRYLGSNILDTGFDFDVHVVNACHLADGVPVWHSAETWANVTLVMREGTDEYASVGTKSSTGTKILSLSGESVHHGLVEVPMGEALRNVIFDVGGGMQEGGCLKGVHVGGTAGGCLPGSMLDTKVDFDELVEAGAAIGSGDVFVMDGTYCVVATAKHMLFSSIRKSCSECIPCREGIYRVYEVLERITSGESGQDDVTLLKNRAEEAAARCRCEIACTVMNPVLSTIRYFSKEYAAHAQGRRCFASVCGNLSAGAVN